MGNNSSLKTTIKKYIEGGIKWATKEMYLLNLGNTNSNNLLDVKVYFGMDLLSQASQCSVNIRISCNTFNSMGTGLGWNSGQTPRQYPMNNFNFNRYRFMQGKMSQFNMNNTYDNSNPMFNLNNQPIYNLNP